MFQYRILPQDPDPRDIDELCRIGITINRFCRQRLLEYARASGLRVFAWGIRSDGPLQHVLRLPIDGVYCDNVEAMVRVLPPRDGTSRFERFPAG